MHPRVILRTVALMAALVALPTLASAQQKNCVKGKPCGNTCIAQNKTCRIGTSPSTRTAPAAAAVEVPDGAQFVASSRGQVYYWIECSAWKSLAPQNLRFFNTREEAAAAGYRPSASSGCAGPTSLDQTPSLPVPDGEETSDTTGVGSPVANTAPRECVTERVIDGDTFACDDGTRVRLLLIDAPELDQGPHGQRATDALAELLPVGSVVELELDVQHRDRYGRTLAHVRRGDGHLANLELVRRGYAVVTVYPPNVRHVERFRAAQDSARAERRGLWAEDAFACEPAEHRRGECE